MEAVGVILSIAVLLIILWSRNRKDEEKQQEKDLVTKWAKDNPEEANRIWDEVFDEFSEFFPDKNSKDEQKQ